MQDVHPGVRLHWLPHVLQIPLHPPGRLYRHLHPSSRSFALATLSTQHCGCLPFPFRSPRSSPRAHAWAAGRLTRCRAVELP